MLSLATDDSAEAVFLALGGAFVGLVGLAVALFGLLVLGLRYIQTPRPGVGYALVGGPILSMVGIVVGAYTDGGSLRLLPVVLTSFAVGYELWTRAEPLPETGRGDT